MAPASSSRRHVSSMQVPISNRSPRTTTCSTFSSRNRPSARCKCSTCSWISASKPSFIDRSSPDQWERDHVRIESRYGTMGEGRTLMRRLLPCKLVCVLAVLLTIGGCLGIGATSFGEEVAEPLTASQVLDRIRKSLAAISSISYEFKNDLKTSQTTGSFAWSEKRFYSTFISERPPGTVVMHEHVAFDGELHQRFSARLTELSVSAKPFVAGKNPYMAQQPILIPFFFVRLDQEESRT